MPEKNIQGEMLELAEHIIKTKKGKFDITKFDDRYEAALAELVKAKIEGKPIEAPKPRKEEKVVDLMAALRESAGLGAGKAASKAPKKSRASKTPRGTPQAPQGGLTSSHLRVRSGFVSAAMLLRSASMMLMTLLGSALGFGLRERGTLLALLLFRDDVEQARLHGVRRHLGVPRLDALLDQRGDQV